MKATPQPIPLLTVTSWMLLPSARLALRITPAIEKLPCCQLRLYMENH